MNTIHHHMSILRSKIRAQSQCIASLLIGLLVGLAAAGIGYLWRGNAGDLGSGLCLARAILGSPSDFYVHCPPAADLPQDTLFAGILMLPFVALPEAVTGAIWIGTTSGILAWALIQKREYWRLLLFVTPAYWMTLWNMQSGALLCIIALYPNFLPIALVKPAQALVIGIWRFSWHRLLLSGAVLALSIIFWPSWFLDWFQQARGYQALIPLLVVPVGPLLLLALLAWRDDRMRLLLLMSCLPQRSMYNALLLYLLPATSWEMVIVVVSAWIGVAIWIMLNSGELGLVVGCYLPMLFVTHPFTRARVQRVSSGR